MTTRGFKLFLFGALLVLRLNAADSPKPTASVTLEWDKVVDVRVQEVRLYYGGRTHLYDGFFPVPPGNTSAQLAGLEPGEEYYVAAATHSEAQGDGQLSREVHFRTSDFPIPNPPIHIEQ